MLYYFLKLHLHLFSKKEVKEVTKTLRNQGFSYYFCLMMEGSGALSGGPKTYGSGSAKMIVKQHFLYFVVVETNHLSLFQEQGDARHDKRPEISIIFFIYSIVRSFVVQQNLFSSSCYFLVLCHFLTDTVTSVPVP